MTLEVVIGCDDRIDRDKPGSCRITQPVIVGNDAQFVFILFAVLLSWKVTYWLTSWLLSTIYGLGIEYFSSPGFITVEGGIKNRRCYLHAEPESVLGLDAKGKMVGVPEVLRIIFFFDAVGQLLVFKVYP
jgi:hypothetical protein